MVQWGGGVGKGSEKFRKFGPGSDPIGGATDIFTTATTVSFFPRTLSCGKIYVN